MTKDDVIVVEDTPVAIDSWLSGWLPPATDRQATSRGLVDISVPGGESSPKKEARNASY